MSVQTQIPWTRYWAPHGHPAAHAWGSEFLPDPDDFFGGSNQHLIKTPDLAKESFAVLGGEPGIGKSTELAVIQAKLKAEGKSVLAFHCKEFPDTATFERRVFQNPQWKQMDEKQEPLTLLIDGVDEGFITPPRFIPFLTAELKDRNISTLQLMLACRTAHWPFADGAQLAALWPNTRAHNQNEEADVRVYELARLRIEDVRAAAAAHKVEPDEFLEEVEGKNVAALAAQPITLFFLIKEFLRSQSLPDTRLEIYERGIRHLCEEPDFKRTEALRKLSPGIELPSVEQAYRIAARVAAMQTVGAKAALFVGKENEIAGADLHLAEIIGGAETTDGTLFQVTSQYLHETLNRPLFESKGIHRTGFIHQTFAEFLSACYLVPLSLTQLRQLLCQQDAGEEAVVPQLQEIATWLAALHEGWRSHLLNHHIEGLLRSDPSKLDATQKVQLVEQLIKRIAEDLVSSGDYSAEFLRGIKYPGLADRLRSLVVDRNHHRAVREFAFAAASHCKLAALAKEVRAVCVDSNEEDGIRGGAGSCLIQLLPEDSLGDLIPLATGEEVTDSEDECKGYAIQALVPKKWKLVDSLPYLNDPQSPNHFGQYYWLLAFYLPRFVNPVNAVAVLGFVANKPESFTILGASNWFDPLGTRALHTALGHLEDPGMATAVSTLWLRKTREHKPIFTDGEDGTLHVLQTEPDKRRSVLGSILNHAGSRAEDLVNLHFGNGQLLRTEDFEWLLSEISVAPSAQRTLWARSIHIAARMEDNLRQHWDELLRTMSDVPELAEAFAANFSPRILDSPEAQREREAWVEDRKNKLEASHLMELRRDNPQATIDAALTNSRNILRWLDISAALKADGSNDIAKDPSQSPTWLELTDATRSQIQESARQFLIELEAPSCWSDRTNPHRIPACRAAWLVRRELTTHRTLESAVRTKWLPVLLDSSVHGKDHQKEIVTFLMEREPARCHAWLREKLALENSSELPSAQFLRSFEGIWTPAISDFLLWSFQDEGLKGNLRIGIFKILLLTDADRAVALLFEKIHGISLVELETHILLRAAIADAVVIMPVAVWAVVWPLFRDSDTLVRAVFRRINNFPHKQQRRLTELTPTQMQDLYLVLDRNFPYASRSADTADDARMLKSDLLKAITSSGTEEGCQALRNLAQALPEDSPWIMSNYRECLTARRRKEWRPPSPGIIRAMVNRREARFVENADALQETVLESLDRFQRYLTHSELPGASLLWNYENGGQHRINFAPKDEEDLSDEVRRWLMRDLAESKAVILNREVQIRRGQRLDILVQAIGPAGLSHLTCIVEIKGCWNPDVRESIVNQLAKDYLENNGHTHGIYLVGWYLCDRWDRKRTSPKVCLVSRDYDSAVKEVEVLASPFDGQATSTKIRSLVLDCRHPEKPAKLPKSAKAVVERKTQAASKRAAKPVNGNVDSIPEITSSPSEVRSTKINEGDLATRSEVELRQPSPTSPSVPPKNDEEKKSRGKKRKVEKSSVPQALAVDENVAEKNRNMGNLTPKDEK